MTKRFRPWDPKQKWLLPPEITEFIPEGHPAHFVRNLVVEELDLTATVIGRVQEIGLRFTKVLNFHNQQVFIPNRTIANVSRFPHGGIYVYADVQIPSDLAPEKAVQIVENLAQGMWRQFNGIILSEPVVGCVERPPDAGWAFIRVHFTVWPGQGDLIETTFRQQTVNAMKPFNAAYAGWQVPVTYRAMNVARPLIPVESR